MTTRAPHRAVRRVRLRRRVIDPRRADACGTAVSDEFVRFGVDDVELEWEWELEEGGAGKDSGGGSIARLGRSRMGSNPARTPRGTARATAPRRHRPPVPASWTWRARWQGLCGMRGVGRRILIPRKCLRPPPPEEDVKKVACEAEEDIRALRGGLEEARELGSWLGAKRGRGRRRSGGCGDCSGDLGSREGGGAGGTVALGALVLGGNSDSLQSTLIVSNATSITGRRGVRRRGSAETGE
ncbi:hypothetical protein B0H17DRAFT_1186529 [Mycena rosella]|uniref:Uncharacterized protein n=1 Tax=Mycena rosella TaxID=1033263 RepID=A0AAD7CLG1_MYCRO|nr:hypothetical protein B0H17DRAFT_1186529 [Mycena rosella]